MKWLRGLVASEVETHLQGKVEIENMVTAFRLQGQLLFVPLSGAVLEVS